MANVNLSNLARMTVSSSGTGTITLNAAVPGFLTFDLSGLSTAAAGSVVRYAINDTTQSEIAYGTYTSSALSLTRGSSTTGMKSTNSNSPINMSASAQVFVTPAAADFPFVLDTAGTTATCAISVTFSVAQTFSAAITYGGVTLNNAVTGTGNMVLSASPTFTGTITAAALTLSGVLTYGGVALNAAVTGTGNMVLSASPTLTGTTTIATLALTTVGAHTISGAITYGGVTLTNAVTGTGSMVLSASPTLTGTLTCAAITSTGTIATSGGVQFSGIVPRILHIAGTGAGLWIDSPTTIQRFFIGQDPTTDNIFRVFSNAASVNILSYTGSTTTWAMSGTFLQTGSFGLGAGAIQGGCSSSVAFAAGANFAFSVQNSSGTGAPAMAVAAGDSSTTDASAALITFYTGDFSSIIGAVRRTGVGVVSYETTSDERGKPNRERLAATQARAIIDALEVYDYDKDGNDIRGVGLLAQQARAVHSSFGSPPVTEGGYWTAEKAAPMPFVIANMQEINQRLDQLEQRIPVRP